MLWPLLYHFGFEILILWIWRGNILCWGMLREIVKPPISPLCQFSLIIWLSYHFGFVNLVLWIWRQNVACMIESKISVGENKCISQSSLMRLNCHHIPQFGYFSLVLIFTGTETWELISFENILIISPRNNLTKVYFWLCSQKTIRLSIGEIIILIMDKVNSWRQNQM